MFSRPTIHSHILLSKLVYHASSSLFWSSYVAWQQWEWLTKGCCHAPLGLLWQLTLEGPPCRDLPWLCHCPHAQPVLCAIHTFTWGQIPRGEERGLLALIFSIKASYMLLSISYNLNFSLTEYWHGKKFQKKRHFILRLMFFARSAKLLLLMTTIFINTRPKYIYF